MPIPAVSAIKDCVNDCACCDECEERVHFECMDMEGSEAELQQDTWYCPFCR